MIVASLLLFGGVGFCCFVAVGRAVVAMVDGGPVRGVDWAVLDSLKIRTNDLFCTNHQTVNLLLIKNNDHLFLIEYVPTDMLT